MKFGTIKFGGALLVLLSASCTRHEATSGAQALLESGTNGIPPAAPPAQSPPSPSPVGPVAAGSPRFMWSTSSSTDPYTDNPTAAQEQWIAANIWGMQVYTPYFDSKLSWFANGFAYYDSYALYTPGYIDDPTDPQGQVASQHPDWVLKDQNGNWLFIPFACGYSYGCSQYAADFSNQAFINQTIQNLQTIVTKGYHALWIDDVNLTFRVGDGNGNFVTPWDVNTGAPMTQANWTKYFSQYLQQIRAAFPGVTILHNSIWYADAGDGQAWNNSWITAEIQAADYLNLERGVNDPGLTGGEGTWSVDRLLTYVDYVHGLGKGVVFDAESVNGINANDPSTREYSLAAYFTISSGLDAVGNDAAKPDNWWTGYGVQLGAPLGARYVWNGLLRRDFQNGIVLVNEPSGATVTVTLPQAYVSVDTGAQLTAITLAGTQGAVLTSR